MLELKHISYRVAEETPTGAHRETDILRDVNLTIDERFVAITGPNGSGKSTLAKIIAGI
ncbi:MAG: ATP-binding cassette domain-containing protein, partial [Clostridia bacterium]|nr:ATP-binding cassette domain-containing protein [Clostridia bacterium]